MGWKWGGKYCEIGKVRHEVSMGMGMRYSSLLGGYLMVS